MKKAILIGINYKNTSSELHGCISDVNNMYKFLNENCEFQKENMHVLTEETEKVPTRLNIEKEVDWLISGNLYGDVLLFYYSGHGAYIKDTSNGDVNGYDETIVPLDYETQGVITDDWLYNYMVKKIEKDITLIGFSDSCHSGSVVNLKYNMQFDSKRISTSSGQAYIGSEWSDDFLLSIDKGSEIVGNCCFFSGCRDTETSADAFINNINQGAFTSCLLDCLRCFVVKMPDTKTRFQKGKLKLRNLLKDVNGRLQIGGFAEQHSQLSFGNINDFEKFLDF